MRRGIYLHLGKTITYDSPGRGRVRRRGVVVAARESDNLEFTWWRREQTRYAKAPPKATRDVANSRALFIIRITHEEHTERTGTLVQVEPHYRTPPRSILS